MAGLSYSEVASRLGVGVDEVKRLVAVGELRAELVDAGGYRWWIVRPRVLREYVASLEAVA